MQYCLPPGTANSPHLGQFSISASLHYLNTTAPTLGLALKLWGYSHPLPFSEQPTGFTLGFAVTTNMGKLTQYLKDAGVLVIILQDLRSERVYGVAYLKVRTYIVNNRISAFQEQVQIVDQGARVNEKSRKILGSLKIKVDLQVPDNASEGKTHPFIPSENKLPTHIIDKTPDITNPRKLLINPHIFEQTDQYGELRDFAITQHDQSQRRDDRGDREEDEKDMHELLSEMQGQRQRGIMRKRPYKEVIIEEEKSLQNYPNVQELQEKYGKNNIFVEKMKLKYDQACLLGGRYREESAEGGPTLSGFLLHVGSLKTMSGPEITETNVSLYRKKNKNTVYCSALIHTKDPKQSTAFLPSSLERGDTIQFQDKNHKARYQIENIEVGKPLVAYLRRKDNNKKSGEVDFIINQMHLLREAREHTREGNQSREGKEISRQRTLWKNSDAKKYYYLSIENSGRNKNTEGLSFQILCEKEKQPAEGRKVIFSSLHHPEVSINISNSNQKQNFKVSIDKQINIKSTRIQSVFGEFRVLTGVADSVEELLKLVAVFGKGDNKKDKDYKDNIASKDPSSYPSPQREQDDSLSDSRHNNNMARIQKLMLLIESFECLLQTQNSECMNIIHKLSTQTNPETSLALFNKLCQIADMPSPSHVTDLCFNDLLHCDFGMFWACFTEYRRLNEIYGKTVKHWGREVTKVVEEQQYTQNNSGISMEKLVRKMKGEKSILFGLMSNNSCLKIVYSFLENSGIAQNNESNSIDFTGMEPFKNFITLLCRHWGSDHSIHCIKIEELEACLTHRKSVVPISLNYHQLLSIAHRHHSQDMSLLVQLITTCVGEEESPSSLCLCHSLAEMLEKVEEVESESSQYEADGRMETDHYSAHMRTQARVPTLEDNRNDSYRRETNPTVDKEDKEEKEDKNKEEKGIVIALKQLCIQGKNEEQILAMIINIKQVIHPQKQAVRINAHALPQAVSLSAELEYRVEILTAQNQEEAGEEVILYGVFVGVSNIKKILLYSVSGIGSEQASSGYIGCKHAYEEHQDEKDRHNDEEEIVLEIHDEVRMPIEEVRQREEDHNLSERGEQEEQQIIKEEKRKTLTHELIGYKILSMRPEPREDDEYLLTIEGASNMIQYPTRYVVGKIKNEVSSQFICFKLHSHAVNSEMIPKIEGVHDVCFSYESGEVAIVLSIELTDYFGQDFLETQKQSSMEKVLILNLYHLDSLMPMDFQEHELRLTIATDSQAHPLCSKVINVKDKHLRSLWVGFSSQIEMSPHYHIDVYCCSKKNSHLLCSFSFKIEFHCSIGIYCSKAYLEDCGGYRLALNAMEINYNDIFCKHQIGKQKFESLLTVFHAQNFHNMIGMEASGYQDWWRQSSLLPSEQALKRKITSSFGFTNTQLHLLLQLQTKENQINKQFMMWDIDTFIDSTFAIDLKNYSLRDIYAEYEIFDFSNCGKIPLSKAQLVNSLVFKGSPLPVAEFLRPKREERGFIHDICQGSEQEVDYLMILWNLRKFAKCDEFFCSSGNGSSGAGTKVRMEETYINMLAETSEWLEVKLVQFRSLRVNGRPATLVFYINGQRVCEPIPRCVNHVYPLSPTVTTRSPLRLEVKNKKYGVKELYTEELVFSGQILLEEMEIMEGGVIRLQINSAKENRNINTNQSANARESRMNTTTNNKFRQSRREQWEKMKNSKVETDRIASILKKEETY